MSLAAFPIVWCVVAIVAVIALSYALLRYFSDKEDHRWYLTLCGSCAMSASLCVLLLIPIDIYSVSWDLNDDGYQRHPQQVARTGDAIKLMYMICYMVMMALAFVIMPFVYFYFEEEDDTDTRDGRQRGGGGESTVGHACAAARYTLVFIALFAVIIGIAFVVKNDQFARNNNHNNDENTRWYRQLEGDFSAFDAVVSFIIACLAMFGLLSWTMYGAFGLVVLPKRIMQSARNNSSGGGGGAARDSPTAVLLHQPPKSSLSSRGGGGSGALNELQAEIEFLKGKYKYARYGDWLSDDRVKLRNLQSQERKMILAERTGRGRGGRDGGGGGGDGGGGTCCAGGGGGCMNARCALLAPIRGVIGIALMCVSLVTITSMFLGALDKLLHSHCKAHCGYAVDRPRIFNPLDRLFVALAPTFPLDWFVFSALIVYFFLACVVGMMEYGVRFFCIRLYDIKRGASMPHGLVMGVWLLMFAALALNYQLITLLPAYTTFGDQRFTPANNSGGGSVQCSTVYANTTHCVMTQIAVIINTTQISQPFFGVVFFWSTYVFVFMVVIAMAREFVCTRNRDDDAAADDDLDAGFESYHK